MSDEAPEIAVFLAVKKWTERINRLIEEYYAPYEAERAVAHFEGRVAPSPEVFFAETARSTAHETPETTA